MSECMNEIESKFYEAWMRASYAAFATRERASSTMIERLESHAEECEAHARYLRFRAESQRVRELKEGTSREA